MVDDTTFPGILLNLIARTFIALEDDRQPRLQIQGHTVHRPSGRGGFGLRAPYSTLVTIPNGQGHGYLQVTIVTARAAIVLKNRLYINIRNDLSTRPLNGPPGRLDIRHGSRKLGTHRQDTIELLLPRNAEIFRLQFPFEALQFHFRHA